MGRAERERGKRGEREARDVWNRLFGTDVRRSQQFCGASDESDDLVGQPGVSLEVKRRNRLNVAEAVEKASDDAAPGRIPVVLHRADHKPWLVTLRLDDLPQLAVTLFHTLAAKG